MPEALDKITAAVAEFHNWIALPRHGRLSPKLMFEFTPESIWSDAYKADAGLPGCYVFEDNQNDLYYVGSVSASKSFGYRFANGYVCKDPEDNKKIKRLGNASLCRQIYVIDVPKEYAFVAPALEQFLITYLRPKCNLKDRVRALHEVLVAEGRLEPVR